MSAVAESSTESRSNYTLPSGTTLQHCAKLAIVEDKPIMFDYWTSSCDKEVLIGVRENEEKLLATKFRREHMLQETDFWM